MDCESCGLPLQNPEDHGGEDPANRYCKYCAPEGKLKSREEVREGWIGFVIKTENIPREEAEDEVDQAMAQMPAWK